MKATRKRSTALAKKTPSELNRENNGVIMAKKQVEIELPSEESIAKAFTEKDVDFLHETLVQLTKNTPLQLFHDLKRETDTLERQRTKLIAELQTANTQLMSTNKTLSAENERLSAEIEDLKKQGSEADTNKYETVLDLIQVVTGLSCWNYEETSTEFTFYLQKTGNTATLFFRLVAYKDSKAQDLYYEPMLDYDDDEVASDNESLLRECLSPYFLDDLKVGVKNARRFFGKLSSDLDKK